MVEQITSLSGVSYQNTWLTIGSFDGVHIGHQQLINQLVAQAHQANNQAAVLTFHPHPALVLRGRKDAFYLSTPAEKADLLGQLGIDIVITHPFTIKVSHLSAHE